MTRFTETMPVEYFEELYRSDPDPWRFGSSEYEKAKYVASLAALPSPRYRRALEVGCSIGVLTLQLADRCDFLLAIDASTTALEAARARCSGLDHVEFATAAVPDGFPDGNFDLIVLSELVYYLSLADVQRLAERCRLAAVPNGHILLVHWTGETNYPLTADAAVEAFIEAVRPRARPLRQSRESAYRVDLLCAQDEIA